VATQKNPLFQHQHFRATTPRTIYPHLLNTVVSILFENGLEHLFS